MKAKFEEKPALNEVMETVKKMWRKIKRKKDILLSYISDAMNFAQYNMKDAEGIESYRYQILLIVHSLEKGMSRKEQRPFGAKKVNELLELLKEYPQENREDFEYRMGVSILVELKKHYVKMGWLNEEVYTVLSNAPQIEERLMCGVGWEIFHVAPVEDAEHIADVLCSRFSARSYQKRSIEREDIDFALNMFCKAPSACNRQMCRVYSVENETKKRLLAQTIHGMSGIETDTVHFFIVTYDITGFNAIGERDQGNLNAGLAAMNFVNGLHLRGIGSCFLEWSNDEKTTERVKAELGIPKNEKIAVAIGAGYYLEENIAPRSCRRNRNEVFLQIK